MNLYITRHGQSEGNIHKYEGPDPDLTEMGRFQARRLGERLAGVKLDAIFSSPLLRALRTANEVALRQPGTAPVALWADLMECSTEPFYEGAPEERLREACPSMFRPEKPFTGENFLREEDMCGHLARAYRVISYIRKTFTGDENVLLVAHGTYSSSLVPAALNFGLPAQFTYSSDNTGLTLVRYITDSRGLPRTKLAFMNDTGHLYGVKFDEGGVRG